jgi:hypothetical protein
MTPIELLQLQAAGLQDEVNSLQAQLKGDEGTIRALQSSLQTLQTTFANHSHKVVIEIPGHLCTGLDTFIVTDAATGNPRRVSLQFAQACTNPKWDGATPNSFESLSVSTPIQGAQPPQ